jgi:hypothetical protein
MVDLLADGLDALALNQHFAGRDNLARGHIKQPRGVEHDGRRWGLLRGSRCCNTEGQSGGNKRRMQAQTEVWHG